MPKYEVLHDFKDLEDKGKIYRKGNSFPQPANKKIKKDRIEELSSTKNKLGKKLIEETREQE
ncbi:MULTISPECIES: hypothetical protein [unclassified Sporosarcina]|uniref:hypothetical protein n=1 Tax=unclassified Sporosarcina TaxID=2647733 RepID=UPI00203EB096|nr:MULTISPECIES: hypothetical protein [unclassified Sporosarcina]GKV64680.1 hypothetical protein NCCP2331_08330 [Sporosarcina sp. NCCP-2331]GLB54447.1 hypothetical protein NCCP2378_02320 [Sporosarcina sp. NCCP-2378]